MKVSAEVPQKAKNRSNTRPNYTTPMYTSDRLKSTHQSDAFTSMFIAALFTVVTATSLDVHQCTKG